MMRKVLSVLFVLTLLLSLTACGGGGEASSLPGENSATTTSTTADAVDSTEGQTTEATGSSTESVNNTTESTGNQATGTTTTGKTPSVNGTTKMTTTTKATTTKAPTTTITTNSDLNGEWVTVNGSSKNLKTWVYQLADSGINVREARIDSGKGGDPVTVIHMTDIHFAGINDKDRQENNEALMWTYNKRKNTFPSSVANTQRCMEYASQFDQTVITGDNIDYLSWGALEMLQKHVWDKDPNALVTLGNHDATRTMSFPDQIADNSSVESRYDMLESFWKHDVYYTSKVIKNKVMVIQMDNGLNRFWDEQVSQFEADIAKAKKNGYVVLLFFHIALKTGTAGRVQSFYPNSTSMSFNSGGVVHNQNDATKKIYDMIINNADVIKGAFCGHEHFNFYTEIKAKTSDGKDAVIPQYILAPVHDRMGNVLKITVS